MVRRAFVFGSNGPSESGRLQYARDDAKQMAEVLKSHRCGFEVKEPQALEDPSDIEKSINEIAESCSDEDTFIIFFSGHGFVEGAALWLMLDKTTIQRPLRTALHADSIVKAMKFCSARHKILILDCCHAGMVFSESRFKNDVGTRMENVLGQSNIETGEAGSSFIAIVASDRLERAREFDALRGSFLTRCICDALGSSFDIADRDRDGAIDLADLRAWFNDRAHAHNVKSPNARVPVPFVFGRERGRLFFTRGPDKWLVSEFSAVNGMDFIVLPFLASKNSVWALGKTPVTNSQYHRFVKENRYEEPVGQHFFEKGRKSAWAGPFRPWEEEGFFHPDQPVVCVNLKDALAFTLWVNKIDNRLSQQLAPTDVWDFAAFGAPRPSYEREKWMGLKVHDKSPAPALVSGGHGRVNQYGLIDLFGNVWEWTLLGHHELLSRVAMLGRSSDEEDWRERNQQIRGGGFLDDLAIIDPVLSASAMKDGIWTKHSDLGFRLAAEIALDHLPSDVVSRLSSASKMPRERPFRRFPKAA
ncbi:hypothetical protein LMG3410_03687 [Achromobacter aegrifaciens]|uniref:SUMF1/EgtB/PvdO family nonheme iron enzyme n=1 Tax=Achromobacter aegrifaciens TaxID=1287736 RepID=UPI001467D687|nr:SUMF1/EgtB/PvdO family nonheme iron enzyme [Achromobacter aegrifaciens]CAB3888444.1 hypothetical protein LMG3410_03687 [Achromobacter aegrifaciens]